MKARTPKTKPTKKPKVYCFVPGCTNKPVMYRHEGYGRCLQHRYVKQDGVQGRGVA